MPLLHWSLRTIQQTQIAGGFTVVTTTDVACHQWLRHTFVVPKRHPKGVLVRGITMMTDVRFCFVAFEDLEQDEAGDTYTHTFTWTGWVNCMTQYFYFWATSAGEKMKSTSPIFSKHYLAPPVEYTFYPDTGTGLVTCDSLVRRYQHHTSWGDLALGPGTTAYPTWDTLQFYFQSYTDPGFWRQLMRSILTFDTSSIPGEATISAARLETHIKSKLDDLVALPAYNVFAASPAQDNNIQAIDSTPFSTEKGYADLNVDTRESWHLNDLGIANINKGGISRFAIRETKYDLPNAPPPWKSNKYSGFSCWARESGIATSPSLVVTY